MIHYNTAINANRLFINWIICFHDCKAWILGTYGFILIVFIDKVKLTVALFPSSIWLPENQVCVELPT